MTLFNIKFIRSVFLSSLLSGLLFITFMNHGAAAPWAQVNTKQDVSEGKEVEKAKAAEKKLQLTPENTKVRKEYYLDKESAVNALMRQAEEARSKGDIDTAKNLYDRVLTLSPEHQAALLEKIKLQRETVHAIKLEKATEYINKNQFQLAKKLINNVLLENPQQKNALSLNEQLIEKMGRDQNEPPVLKPPFDTPISLEFREANIKVVFEALSRATGINFILDREIPPETRSTIFIRKMPIIDAIEMVLSSNGLQKKVLSENTVLVFQNTANKLKDHQNLMIRNFYFTNSSAKQASLLLKTILKAKDIYVDDRLNMLVMRDTPEAIRIAEKLIAANDLADPEVMLEIEVLEVSRNRLQELGIVYPNQLSVLGGTTGLTLDELKNVTSKTIGVSPNPALNFKKTTGDVNLLSNPRIRVKNNEKAKILVGDKVPIITTTSTANVGVSENVTYVDVGLKLDVEPRITLDNFVNIKVGLEVSSLGEKTVTKNGASVFTIGTRNASTILRLKNGETQILAGLILDDERKNASKLPGLGDIPLIGRLFSNHEDKKSKTEIVLAITPRVIGNILLPENGISEYWSGTENLITDNPQTNISAPPAGKEALTPLDRLEQVRQERLLQLNSGQGAKVIPESVPLKSSPESIQELPAVQIGQ
jgi:general secretion pathway protein D